MAANISAFQGKRERKDEEEGKESSQVSKKENFWRPMQNNFTYSPLISHWPEYYVI